MWYQILPQLFILSRAASALSISPSSENPIVDLTYAKYEGVRDKAFGIDKYLGMRYAEAPLGDLRFRAPRDPTVVADIQTAHEFGPICLGSDQTPSDNMSEDCLFVNVFTPSNATSDSKLPVWLYIQGGGYASNADHDYDGSMVIRESGYNILFANFNYRVGALGFLASEKVRADGDLNVGLLDQRKLLWWVQEHISKFGGDPSHVVIHGTSAGSGSVTHHLTAYGGRDEGLFVGAAPQSKFWPPQRTVTGAEFQFDRFANDTGCSEAPDVMACLRSADLEAIVAGDTSQPLPGAPTNEPFNQFYWLPVVDGDFIRSSLYDQFERGQFVKVPVLVANTNDEASVFVTNPATADEMALFFRNYFPKLTEREVKQILQTYPLQDPLPQHEAWYPSLSAAYGDSIFLCPGYEVAKAAARHFSSDKVWNYRFNMQDPSNIQAGLGTIHAVDTDAILGPGFAGGYAESYLDVNAPIVPNTMHYYISFVRSADPNKYKHETAPLWESWGNGGDQGRRLKLETNSTFMEDIPSLQIHRCNFWRGLARQMEL
ncbi:unnamed protein product [Clonostachys byssicola]|uniref:Carboxylic ester hydrolase n=1 Tax=Clonostachys byssicola TaxID=160290 RepID=A0A9N9UC84_9HYPO|nr:unnamed protein product [Clonostachys byssicola]